jgi:type I restriction enzyme R subunit
MALSTSDESERQTRRQRIDPRLRAQGWTVVPFSAISSLASCHKTAIEEYPTENGPADYALCVNGQVLGIVEAKKVTLGPQNVLTQAERYSTGAVDSPLNFHGYRVPFLYSTNGEVTWFHDVRHPLSRSRQIAGFHSPSALSDLFERSFDSETSALQSLANDHPRLRDYQIEASQEVERAIANRKRTMLVAMATGTGKTFTMVNETYRLMKSGVGKRVLFLVDRRALAAQAVRAFASFEAEPGLKFDRVYEVYSQRFHSEDFEDDKFDPKVLPTAYLTDPKPGDAFVYVCTIQRMMVNLFGRDVIFGLGDEEIDEDADQVSIPIHAFDVIIADECHRGYTSAELSVWRKTLDHFDAIKIGLTATPAAHTKAYFSDIVFRYDYERAVREGYLVDYDVVKLHSDVRINGVFLNEGEQVGYVNARDGTLQMDLLEDERQFDASEVEEKVTAPDSNRKVLEELRRYCTEHEQEYGRFPKTLIFAANDVPHTSHADQLVNIARDVFGRGDSFVQKITGRVDRPLRRIKEFRNRDLPGVVVTVDMLSTGVDIPDLEFIVFLRPVKSRILFEQMLGRGTRKGERFPDKNHFTVFDCFDGTLLEYFRNATGITAEPPETEARSIIQVIDDIWSNKDRDYNIRCLVKRLQRIDKQMSGEARQMFAAFIPGGDVARFAADLPEALRDSFTGTMVLLRDPRFQDLLLNYPRAPRTFLVAYEAEDEVSSEWLVRGADGKEYKPDDYLQAFVRFVDENSEKIDAISVLLDRPGDWSVQSLVDLRKQLEHAPQGFRIDLLQRVHQLTYGKALVDVISMVKHAAREVEPLLTAEERVSRAMNAITAGLALTEEQTLWLDRIRVHLVENLSIDKDDFDLLPVFTRHGGWRRANETFGRRLDSIIRKANEAIAA